ncbi:SGNH/GDSL hydrolase family protein [Pseudomonas gingeri]|uniref:SGNH/GDSL hydrolase family protein n=1 Tax=Pseudomonas gingeri TaxID=117681 RepID=A0A7Y7YIG1_9PSED|nr:SGNH/GDSL hydrolase family protein [Pseudomonas gingeri]NWB31166.1 SGNH/GDSL hydrolase family protein [Pseudomonas gingeri]NWC37061.1 SGNH/GDSL hydrolase family protein [Pseudomonas gingeri]
MLELLIKVTLGPLLLAQGIYTRWKTPKLPEASGERQGTTGEGAVLRLLILGDSAAAGVGAETQHDALVGKLVAQLGQRYRVVWKLMAQSGLDSSAVVRMLEGSSSERFDVVVVSVGVNDVIGGVSLNAWEASLRRLVDILRWKFDASLVVFSRVPPMHTFVSLPHPLRWYLGGRAKRLERHLARWVEHRQGCAVLDRHPPVSGELMAADGFHPGPALYALWADDVVALLSRRLDKGLR